MKYSLLLTTLVALCLTGCGGKPGPVAVKKHTQIGNRSLENLSANLFLVPVNHDGSTRKPSIPFEQLLLKVSEDKDCLSLARRLFWDLPFELAVVANENDWNAVPKEKEDQLYAGPPFVYLQVKATTDTKQSTDSLLAGMWNIRRLSLQESEQAPPASERKNEVADEAEALILLCNDYLLRQDADWIMVTSQDSSVVKAAVYKLDEAKANHAMRIDDYIQKYAVPTKP